ncbi:Uncharacterised protein [Raoultella terrigena]|uniref:Uncharacterized protein n=1 Tax=Raoultella terrigena TaxID=577 RepID=A0A4U9DCL8_RAOTE|nr:Uncharacterised protein [Raoultella terrigena]
MPSVAIGLVISFIPALHEVANFSWFIGVFLSGAGLPLDCPRRSRRRLRHARYGARAVAQKE